MGGKSTASWKHSSACVFWVSFIISLNRRNVLPAEKYLYYAEGSQVLLIYQLRPLNHRLRADLWPKHVFFPSKFFLLVPSIVQTVLKNLEILGALQCIKAQNMEILLEAPSDVETRTEASQECRKGTLVHLMNLNHPLGSATFYPSSEYASHHFTVTYQDIQGGSHPFPTIFPTNSRTF